MALYQVGPDKIIIAYSLDCQCHSGCSKTCGRGKKEQLEKDVILQRLLRWEEAGKDLPDSIAHIQLGRPLLADFKA